MIKDKPQKKLAAKFCAAQGIVPFLEVIVRSHAGLEEIPTDITDVDVLGVDLRHWGQAQRLLFDCKTGSKLSAINRGLWAGGLKIFVGADHAFVLQKKEAPYSHKLAANQMAVHLHSEASFIRYARSIAPEFALDTAYLDDLEIWDRLITIARVQPVLGEALWFASTVAALERSSPRAIRLALSSLMKGASELDPKKPTHRLLFGTFLSSFLLCLALAADGFKEIFQFSMDKDEFSRTLRYFIWEGRDNYVVRRSMKAAIDKVRGEPDATEFDLPEWERFLQLMRSLLDAPGAAGPLSFLAKELAFRSAAEAPRLDADAALRRRFQSNNRSRQFIFGVAGYLVRATRTPQEFATLIENDINALLRTETVPPKISGSVAAPANPRALSD